jgi:hypothetical protein
MWIPDWQVAPGSSIEHVDAIGRYCAYKKPDVIGLAGDMGDFPSCSDWDKALWEFGSRTYGQDMAALEHALQVFLAPILEECDRTGWCPYIFVTLGNHEYRVERALGRTDCAKFRDAVELPAALYTRYGIEVFPYEEPVMVDGIAYCHVFTQPLTGRAVGGMMQTRLKTIGFSFTQGHQQILEVGTRTLANGQVQRGCVAGACYIDDEGYRSGPANLHWRGIIQKNEVDGFGDYSLMDINIEYLLREHGGPPLDATNPDPDWTGCGDWSCT